VYQKATGQLYRRKIPKGLLKIKSPAVCQEVYKPNVRVLRALIGLNKRNQPHLGPLLYPLQHIDPVTVLKLSLGP